MNTEIDTRCYGCEFLTDSGECTQGVDFGEQGCKHYCPPEACDLFEGLETTPETVNAVESITLDTFRALRKHGGVITLTGHGFKLELNELVYLPDLKDALDGFMARLMLHELRLFEE